MPGKGAAPGRSGQYWPGSPRQPWGACPRRAPGRAARGEQLERLPASRSERRARGSARRGAVGAAAACSSAWGKQLAGNTYIQVVHGRGGTFVRHLFQELDGKKTAVGTPESLAPPPSQAPTPQAPRDTEACSLAHLCILFHHGPLHLLVPFPVSPVVKVHGEPGWLWAERASPEGGSSMEGTGQPCPHGPGIALWGERRLLLLRRGDWTGWGRAGRGVCPFICGCWS